jgi:uncharacterized protein YecT (DUF1311 family)
MRTAVTVWLVGGWILSAAASADTPLADCYRRAATRLEVKPCLEAKLSQAEAALRRAEAATAREMEELAAVTGRDEASKAFEAAREAFSRHRQASCHWLRLRAEPGTGAGDIELDCRIRMTGARAAELERLSPSVP